jgi:hypothetical protein
MERDIVDRLDGHPYILWAYCVAGALVLRAIRLVRGER